MATQSLPEFELVENAAAVVAVLGQFNLYDAEIRALRFECHPDAKANVEVDFAGLFAPPIVESKRALEYQITLRCEDVADVMLDGFGRQNVVGHYDFERITPPPSDGFALQVTLEPAAGGSIELRCRHVRVLNVAPATKSAG